MAEVVGASTDDAATTQPQQERAELEESAESERPADPEESASLPLDQVFGILKNERRRRVLKYLEDADEQVSLSELAEQIAAWENDKSVGQISSGERKRVYVGLYQCHLPKMDSMDVVAFNKPRGVIEPGENADVLYEYLERADEEPTPPWHAYSAVLSLAGAATLGGALAVQPMTAMPVLDISVAVVIVAFLAYAFASLNWERTAQEAGEGTDGE